MVLSRKNQSPLVLQNPSLGTVIIVDCLLTTSIQLALSPVVQFAPIPVNAQGVRSHPVISLNFMNPVVGIGSQGVVGADV